MVDYLFGKSIVLNSTVSDPSRRAIIEQLTRLILAQAGGITFLQQLSLLGAVYGFVDVLVKLAPEESCESQIDHTHDLGKSAPLPEANTETSSQTDEPAPAECASGSDDSPAIPGSSHPSLKALAALARRIRLEIVEPSRALPLLCGEDWRKLDAYAQVWKNPTPNTNAHVASANSGWFDRLRQILSPHVSTVRSTASPANINLELITPDAWSRYENGKLISSGVNSLGQIPIVHIQNLAIPFEYEGASEVEPLIPIQDEINTRLCDRGYRISMQAFKMYLGIGIDNFNEMPVAPGRMWMTDNENAKVLEFGGDGKTFSEDNQLGEMREAMDKISGVTPIVAGALKGRIGRLTSAAALKVTMLALLAKTERKRTTYGNGILRICELALAWLDKAGLFPTAPDERQFEINWPNPLPVNELERLQEAQAKLQVGVPSETVLRELGYPQAPL
jgi:hypothetical protein